MQCPVGCLSGRGARLIQRLNGGRSLPVSLDICGPDGKLLVTFGYISRLKTSSSMYTSAI